MTFWLILSISAPLMWGMVNVVDKSMRGNFVKSDFALTWMCGVIRLPIIIAISAIIGFEIPGIEPFLFMLLTGVLWMAPFFLYFKALESEESTKIALLCSLTPVFTLVLSRLILNEQLLANQFFAFASLLLSGVLASIDTNTNGKIKISKAFWLLLCATFCWALSDVLFKKYEPFFEKGLFSAMNIDLLGGLIVAFFMLLIPKLKEKILTPLKNLNGKVWGMIAASYSLGIIGSIVFAYALTLGKASLTGVLLGIQPLFAFIFSIILSKFSTDFSKENTSKKAMLLKLSSFVLSIIGIVLL